VRGDSKSLRGGSTSLRGASQSLPGASGSSLGDSKSLPGASRSLRGASQSFRGGSRSSRGASQSFRGASRSSRGGSRSFRGVSKSSRGASRSFRGASTSLPGASPSIPTDSLPFSAVQRRRRAAREAPRPRRHAHVGARADHLDEPLAILGAKVDEPHAHAGVRVVAVLAHGVDPGDLALQLERLVAGRLEREPQARADGERRAARSATRGGRPSGAKRDATRPGRASLPKHGRAIGLGIGGRSDRRGGDRVRWSDGHPGRRRGDGQLGIERRQRERERQQ